MTHNGEGDPQSLAAAIIALRKRVGSQKKLGALVGVDERTVKRWEHGALPQKEPQAKLIDLGVDANLFMSAASREEIEARLRRAEGEIARIRSLLE